MAAREEQFQLLLESEALSSWVVPLLAELTAGRSQADIARCVRIARREAILTVAPLEFTLVTAAATKSLRSTTRNEAMAHLKSGWNLSNRQIARIFGVSHPTVAAAIRQTGEEVQR